jgi:hypothetical protein
LPGAARDVEAIQHPSFSSTYRRSKAKVSQRS